MNRINLVLGASGHLGSNLVRQLVCQGKKVRAGFRNLDFTEAVQDIKCEPVYADMLDKSSLLEAMEEVDTLFIAAGVYKSWTPNVKKDIIGANVQGTRNILEAATKQGVKKIIYVSTVFTLDNSKVPMNAAGWKKGKSDPYTSSKIEAEKLAWKLAEEYKLWMVSVLPSGMIGPNSYNHLTPTMEVLYGILHNKLPIDPCFNFNLVDVRDVAGAMISAVENALPGTRYILAQEQPISSTQVFQIARNFSPSVTIPKKAKYRQLMLMATISELISKISGKKPLMLRSQVKHMYYADLRYDISMSEAELGFDPRPSEQSVLETFKYLSNLKNN